MEKRTNYLVSCVCMILCMMIFTKNIVASESPIYEQRPSSLIQIDASLDRHTGNKRQMIELDKAYKSAWTSYLDSVNWNNNNIFAIGNQYFMMRRYERALYIFSHSKNDLRNVFGAATSARLIGQNKEAIISYNLAIKMNSSFEESYLGRALAFRNIDDYNKAIADLKKYISMSGRLEGYLALADIYMYLEDYNNAKAIISNGLSRYSNSSELKKMLNHVHTRMK